jgi:hypothetical protein
MTKKTYDWTQPVMSLLHKLQENDVQIIAVNDGEGYEKVSGNTKLATRKDAANMITAVDESWVRVKHKDDNNDYIAVLYIVLGNETSEILADYAFTPGTKMEGILESVSNDFYEQWEDVPCPVI